MCGHTLFSLLFLAAANVLQQKPFCGTLINEGSLLWGGGRSAVCPDPVGVPWAPCGETPPWNPWASAGAVWEPGHLRSVLSWGLGVRYDLGPKPTLF